MHLRHLLLLPWSASLVLLMRLLRPVLMIRIHHVLGSRIGHFAANTELYLCEKALGINQPSRPTIDISYLHGGPSNRQLLRMWRRVLRVWPEWLFEPVYWLNARVPGAGAHVCGNNTQHDRDVHGLLERVPCHLSFTADEEAAGQAALRKMGIPEGARYVCILGRDSAYLTSTAGHGPFDYHRYRDVTIANYVPAAEALAERGIYVLRVGSHVADTLPSTNSRIIDYATNGSRSDFLDVYVAATCLFFLSCGSGLDAVAQVFRRPVAYVNLVPAGYWMTSLRNSVAIFKHHWCTRHNRMLTAREIFERGVGYALSNDVYARAGIEVRENTPAEIREVALEMLDRLEGSWESAPEDDALQARFRARYPLDARGSNGAPLHGALRARYAARFLRDNPGWLN